MYYKNSFAVRLNKNGEVLDVDDDEDFDFVHNFKNVAALDSPKVQSTNHSRNVVASDLGLRFSARSAPAVRDSTPKSTKKAPATQNICDSPISYKKPPIRHNSPFGAKLPPNGRDSPKSPIICDSPTAVRRPPPQGGGRDFSPKLAPLQAPNSPVLNDPPRVIQRPLVLRDNSPKICNSPMAIRKPANLPENLPMPIRKSQNACESPRIGQRPLFLPNSPKMVKKSPQQYHFQPKNELQEQQREKIQLEMRKQKEMLGKISDNYQDLLSKINHLSTDTKSVTEKF